VNKEKLKAAEAKFIDRFPGGFTHPAMLEIVKKHKVEKMKSLAKDSFAISQFANASQMADAMIKVVSQSSLVSVFEKPKFRDAVRSMNDAEKAHLSQGLKEFLHGDQAVGFSMLTGLLQEYKIAKWPVLTVFPIYYRPEYEVFVKPTTAKGIIAHFELTGLKYRAQPNFAFYQAYREQILLMKQEVSEMLRVDNAAFCGFLMMALEQE
jgi:hypothetical protein